MAEKRGRLALCLLLLTAACGRDHDPPPGPPGSKPGILDRALRSPEVFFDEELAVSASSWQMRSIGLGEARRVLVSAQGVKHTDKGFTVYVIPSEDAESFAKHRRFVHMPEFDGTKIRSYSHVDTLPRGQWTIVVQNSENLLNTMIVRLKVVGDPG